MLQENDAAFPDEAGTTDGGADAPTTVYEAGAQCLLQSVSGLHPKQIKPIASLVVRRIYEAMTPPDSMKVWRPHTHREAETGLQTWIVRGPGDNGWLCRTTNDGGPGLDTSISTVWVPDPQPQTDPRIAELLQVIESQQATINMVVDRLVGLAQEKVP